jgi:homocysteine S-methyltransferase
MYDRIAGKLAGGATIILDGGTGTEIQRRGVAMDGSTWCAEANLRHPEVVQAVHEDYIRAGAEIVTANTFATSALLFNALGRDADIAAIDKAAVAIARRAAEGKDVAVAGSMSTMRPVIAGSDRTAKQREWPESQARALFARKAGALAEAGVDFILMEMMRDTDYALWATEAAKDTGLPVWVGLSAERRADGRLTGFGREDRPFEAVAAALAATAPEAVCIMHTSPNDTDEALDTVRRHWSGPLGAYPESGYFTMPDWRFVDIIPPAELVAGAKAWKHKGVTIFGGCCGIGPEHVAALAREFAT